MKKALLALAFLLSTAMAEVPTAPSGLVAYFVTQPNFGTFAEIRWSDNSDNETAFYAERSELVKVKGVAPSASP